MTNRTRAAAGALAAFLTTILIEDALRDDLSPVEHWVSHLSLGPHGWINIVALTGAGLAVLALRGPVRDHPGRKWPTRWLTTTGIGLLIAAILVSDPPPGTQYVEVVTWHGQLHDLGGGLTFLGLFATCLITRTLLSARWGTLVAALIATAWIAASILAAVGYGDSTATMPSGLAERVALFAGVGWLIALAVRLPAPTERSSR